MKQISAVQVLLAVFALLVGLVVGGLGPRAEVRSLEKRLAEAEECPNSTMGSEIANVFRGRPWDGAKAAPAVPNPEPTPDGEEPVEEGTKVQWSFDSGKASSEGMTKDEIDESIDLAREAMELRFTQAREALVQDADPSDEQLAAIDDAIASMNSDLTDLATELTTTLANGDEPGRRETMEFAADTLDVLLSAEDTLLSTLDEDQRASLQTESLDPMSYVDPSIVDILGQLNR